MLSLRGVDRKSYEEWFLEPFPEGLDVPCCQVGLLRPHSSYRRYVDGERMAIRRGRCSSCGVTHAILPEDVCAYRDLSLEDLTTALQARGPSEAARRLGDVTVAGVRRVRRQRREAMGKRAGEAQWILPETRAPTPWWERALAAFGSLVAWRHWLWESTGYFATVLLGLFRQGRPSWVGTAVST